MPDYVLDNPNLDTLNGKKRLVSYFQVSNQKLIAEHGHLGIMIHLRPALLARGLMTPMKNIQNWTNPTHRDTAGTQTIILF